MKDDFDFLPPSKEPNIPADFQDGVLSRIRRDHQRHQQFHQLAVLGLVALSAYTWVKHQQDPMRLHDQPPSPRVASAQNGVSWLLQAQNPDGGWSAENWGGHPRFSVGVSALATLALLNAPDPVDPQAMEEAIRQLEQQLAKDLNASGPGPQLYNLILNLHTLAEVQKQQPTSQRQVLLTRAYRHLLRYQQDQGGWGYLDQNPLAYQQADNANAAVTWWVCHLLKTRPAFSLPGADQALAKGRNWLAKRKQVSGEMMYQPGNPHTAGPDEALFWMAASFLKIDSVKAGEYPADAYRDFFRLQLRPDDRLLASVQAEQQTDGAWENDQDRWWRAGGKVYLTAMSVLSQVPQG